MKAIENWSKLSKEEKNKHIKACEDSGGLPSMIDGNRFVCVKLSKKAEKELQELKDSLNLSTVDELNIRG